MPWSLTKGRVTTDRSREELHTCTHPSPHTKQVHVVLSDVASNEVNAEDDVSSGDEADFEDEEDFQTQTMRRSGIHPNLSECCRCVGECVIVRLVGVL